MNEQEAIKLYPTAKIIHISESICEEERELCICTMDNETARLTVSFRIWITKVSKITGFLCDEIMINKEKIVQQLSGIIKISNLTLRSDPTEKQKKLYELQREKMKGTIIKKGEKKNELS